MTRYHDLMDAPAGGYSCISIDVPWHHKSYSIKGQGRSPSRHYKTMTLEDICALPIGRLAARDCHLFAWTTQPHLEQSFEVLRSWGFRYSSVFLFWVKLNPSAADTLWLTHDMLSVGMGFTTRKSVEVLLLARRGSPKRLNKNTSDVLFSARRQHSRKPDASYATIERYCAGPRIDIFTREERPGWDAFGDEADKFDPDKAQPKVRKLIVPGPSAPTGPLETAMGIRPRFVVLPGDEPPEEDADRPMTFRRAAT